MSVSRRRGGIAGLALATTLAAALAAPACAADVAAEGVSAVAYEARRTVVILNAYYADHHACPQPSVRAELHELEGELGDGFSVEPRGAFALITALMMPSGGWLYYSSPRHPDRCTLWHSVGEAPTLIWRRHRDGARWTLDLGDGKPERPFDPTRHP